MSGDDICVGGQASIKLLVLGMEVVWGQKCFVSSWHRLIMLYIQITSNVAGLLFDCWDTFFYGFTSVLLWIAD